MTFNKKIYHKNYLQRPGVKQHISERMRQYHQIPEVKERQKKLQLIYRQTPKGQEVLRKAIAKYSKKPEVKQKVQRKLQKRQQLLKEMIFSHYSNDLNSCKYCGKKGIPFLTIDHISGRGYRHKNGRKKRLLGFHLYKWLLRMDYPPGFQVLCWNCNMVKYFIGSAKLKELLIEERNFQKIKFIN